MIVLIKHTIYWKLSTGKAIVEVESTALSLNALSIYHSKESTAIHH